MQLDSVRELKAQLSKTIPANLLKPAKVQALSLSARATNAHIGVERTMAFGIAKKAANDFALAIRLQRREVEGTPEFEKVVKQAKNEVDVRYVGRAYKLARPWHQKRCRPLRAGCSVGHYRVTAGTLGCFVRSRKDGTVLMLSNNHVLANEGDAELGDDILQPGHFDLGRKPRSVVGTLANFVKLKASGTNYVDCAVASVAESVRIKDKELRDLGDIAGLNPSFLDEGTSLAKLGRTTGLTTGRVTAFEIDNIVVGFGVGELRFDNQIEIEGDGDSAFSAGGDSGSLIVDDDRRGIALLFAGTDQGGTNGRGLTYGNPLKNVLDQLKVDLL